MKNLVDDTCSASLAKICDTQYTDNPPFSCAETTYPTTLTIISLAGELRFGFDYIYFIYSTIYYIYPLPLQ